MATIEWYDSDEQHSDEIELLKLEGHEVNLHDYLTSEEVERLQTERVDLIVTELYLESDSSLVCPDNKSGLYTLEQVSLNGSINQDTPKLAYTVAIKSEDVEKTRELVGSDNFLRKPIKPLDLVEKIESLL
jgi:CheY-like chemotaxis protein